MVKLNALAYVEQCFGGVISVLVHVWVDNEGMMLSASPQIIWFDDLDTKFNTGSPYFVNRGPWQGRYDVECKPPNHVLEEVMQKKLCWFGDLDTKFNRGSPYFVHRGPWQGRYDVECKPPNHVLEEVMQKKLCWFDDLDTKFNRGTPYFVHRGPWQGRYDVECKPPNHVLEEVMQKKLVVKDYASWFADLDTKFNRGSLYFVHRGPWYDVECKPPNHVLEEFMQKKLCWFADLDTKFNRGSPYFVHRGPWQGRYDVECKPPNHVLEEFMQKKLCWFGDLDTKFNRGSPYFLHRGPWQESYDVDWKPPNHVLEEVMQKKLCCFGDLDTKFNRGSPYFVHRGPWLEGVLSVLVHGGGKTQCWCHDQVNMVSTLTFARYFNDNFSHQPPNDIFPFAARVRLFFPSSVTHSTQFRPHSRTCPTQIRLRSARSRPLPLLGSCIEAGFYGSSSGVSELLKLSTNCRTLSMSTKLIKYGKKVLSQVLKEAGYTKDSYLMLDNFIKEKRKVAQDLQKNNLHLHRLSRGGYDRLEEIMIREASSLATGDQSDLISPPPRHEKWKRARTKPSGEYTYEETRLVAENIDDLVEKRSKGSFTQEGRDDILAVAIGRPEHPGYIRGVGRGVGLKQFFGGPTRKVTLAQLSESDKMVLRNEFKKEMFPELRNELLAEIKSEIASLGLTIQVPPKGASHVASTKGSCPLPEESGDGADVPVDCELYVADAHLHLVALDIKDSSARVPLPSEEVQTVGQAPGNFIIWPARLAKPILEISKKTNIVTPPQPQLSPLQQLGASVVTMGNKTIEVDMPLELTCKIATTTLFICHRDICEIVTGNDLLSTTVLQLWNLYLHHLSIERRNATVYGFLDPVIIQSVGNKSEEVQKYLIEMFEKAGKDVYLAPYLHKHNGKMVGTKVRVCPTRKRQYSRRWLGFAQHTKTTKQHDTEKAHYHWWIGTSKTTAMLHNKVLGHTINKEYNIGGRPTKRNDEDEDGPRL
ncbi:hypothetical protein V8G54_002089 [Vigna mungo]|uniref:Uncharacterized protein n=1 Tax=Vigna mungo TaxID=3915 RepID=A0AAQ3P9J9_VIGMU